MPPSSPPPSSRPTSPSSIMTPSQLTSAMEQRRRNHVSSRSTYWLAANTLAALAVAAEIQFGRVREGAGIRKHQPYFYVLTTLLLILLINVAWSLWSWIRPLLLSNNVPIVLTSRQMRLLRVNRTDPGFKLSSEANTSTPSTKHPNPFGPPLDGSFVLPPSSPSPMDALSISARSNNASLNSSSWIFHDNKEGTPAVTASSPQSPNQKRAAFVSSMGHINDEVSLRGYLDEFDVWERQRNNSSFITDQQSPDNTARSYWRPSGTVSGAGASVAAGGLAAIANTLQDYSPVLNRLAYQLSTPMPGSTSTGEDRRDDRSSLTLGHRGKKEDICYLVGIEPLELVSWMENLRLWISQTILKRLVVEMDETNEQLIKLGLKEVLLGETGLEKVIKSSRLPHVISSIPTLPRLISFLELCHDQDYLVSRVRELASGGAMSGYRWDRGGKYKGVEWSADRGLPTDAELLMHCINCYFDARLPPVEGVIDGRVFSTLHFAKETAVKPTSTLNAASSSIGLTRGTAHSASEASSSSSPSLPSSSFAIIQTASRPAAPHFALRVGEGSQRHRLEVSSGRNNLFHTLLLFLHHVKTKEHGVLGRINLGPSGLNVLWVIE